MPKNHQMVNGKLLQTNKQWSALKEKQKEWITETARQAHSKAVQENGKPVNKTGKLGIIDAVYEQIEAREIWIPYRTFPVYARSKLCLAKYTYAQAKRYAGSNVRILMNHPGMTVTPMGLNAFGKGVRRLAGFVGSLSNSPEKSALSLAYILSHDVPAGTIVGPNKGFGGWGYPEINRVGRRVKEGADELIRFTNKEIEKAKGQSANQ